MAIKEDVYITLVMDDGYLPGAAVLSKSLKDAGTGKKLAVLIDQDNLSISTVTALQALFDYTIPIQRVGNPRPQNLYLMQRPDLLYTFTKIHLWQLTQYRKIVYLDSDVLALRSPDELFDLTDDFCAAPDVGFPDIFNSGVMVLSPNMGDFWALQNMAAAGDSFDGADQGLLNQYFEHKPWKQLSFTYNCTPSANYQYEPAYRHYKHSISLVHFIGKQKPWHQGHAAYGAPGAYQELASRWWAVYDRHFKVSSPENVAVQQQVRGEILADDYGYYASGYPVDSVTSREPSEALATTTEAPFTEPGESAENIDQGRVEPQPTADVRRFSAPHKEWDATRQAPPSESKPEASNFPTSTYDFSADANPYRPPAAFPEPPRDLHYGSQPKTEEKLPPIFPWEEREVPKPTRRFVEDEPAPAPPEAEPELDFAGADELEVQSNERTPITPVTPVLKSNGQLPLQAMGASTKNAWDADKGIDEYVRALEDFQRNRDKVQEQRNHGVLHYEQQHILSPTNEPDPQTLIDQVQKRRESLILTDFPSAVERPSLPVTPAPIRRPSFWGAERDDHGELPPAEGVPSQVDWDPSAQLEQLRRNSVLASDLKLPSKKSIPMRDMPRHSIAEESEEATSQVSDHTASTNAAKAAPTFSEPSFAATSHEGGEEAVISPTDHVTTNTAS